jgi:hypothetical protein
MLIPGTFSRKGRSYNEDKKNKVYCHFPPLFCYILAYESRFQVRILWPRVGEETTRALEEMDPGLFFFF